MGSGDDGDDGFAGLYREHWKALLRFAWLMTGDAARAEDAVAEALANVWPLWRAGRVRNPSAYLRRAILNELMRGRRRLLLERRHGDRRSGDHRGIRQVAEQVADQEAVWRALLGLPAEQRAAIVLRYFEDLTEAQTAEVLNVSVGTVKSRVSRGLARLRPTLEETINA
jgi:RNA polymerase sigma-70 factor (sigma-E family)